MDKSGRKAVGLKDYSAFSSKMMVTDVLDHLKESVSKDRG
jgi:hypothetical protein